MTTKRKRGHHFHSAKRKLLRRGSILHSLIVIRGADEAPNNDHHAPKYSHLGIDHLLLEKGGASDGLSKEPPCCFSVRGNFLSLDYAAPKT